MIYLDNAATTMPVLAATEKFNEVSRTAFANSASLHGAGAQANRVLEEARRKIASILLSAPEEIIFTSGGTESNNIAVFGALSAFTRKGEKEVVTSGYEHASVFSCAQNCDAVHVTVDAAKSGFDVNAFREKLSEKTALVSVMLVNSETGLISPVAKIAKLTRLYAPNALIHCDAVQGFCKIPFSAASLGVDLISMSAHKVGGVKGVGALYIRKGVRILSPVFGGGHERGIRSGTVNVAGIAAFAQAASEAYSKLKENYSHVLSLKKHLCARLEAECGAVINGFDEVSPYIISATFKGCRGETLLSYLSEREIYVATASACSSHKKSDSRVLLTQGVSEEAAKSTLRISFCPNSTLDECDILADTLKTAITEIVKGVN